MALTTDLTIHQGEDVVIDVTVWSDETKTTVRDINGATAVYRIGKIGSDKLVLSKAAQITNGGQGQLRISLLDSETANLAARRYTHQVVVTDTNGLITVVTDGFLTVKETLPNS